MGKTILAGAGLEDLPYSEAVLAGGFVFLSGLVALAPDGRVINGGISEQTCAIFAEVKRLLALADATLDDVVKVNVYLTNAGDFEAFNEAYRRYFLHSPPARISMSVQLTIEALVEIDLVAYVGDRR